MKFLKSIRWQLQLWHSLLLALVLAGFGFTALQLQWANQLRRIDQEMEQRISVVSGVVRRGNPGRPPQDRRPPAVRQDFGNLPPAPPEERLLERELDPLHDRPPQARPRPGERQGFGEPPLHPPEVHLSERDATLFEGPLGRAFYYVVWLPGGRELSRSASAPPDVPRPERVDGTRDSRLRGTVRECFHFTGPGECILVGRDIREELAGMQRSAWLLVGEGCAVFLLGLGGGWWITTRALRPIADISATAARISAGDLSQRIHTAHTSSELGGLVSVLNETFSRLQSSFARQAQFTADASHELRTPVSVVLTQTQTALARERPAAEYRESLEACQRAAQRMRRLTESLLTLARLDSGEGTNIHGPCNLDRIASEAVELLSPLAREQEVTLHLELVPVCCLGNAEQLTQVITNLVGNAIHHNCFGGSVQVKVAAESDAAVVSVSDTGHGIAPDDLPHIFERFYRADKARSSASGRTGLGLAITKAIVEAHGGTIQVISELDKGSTFTVRLRPG